jgi:hypothetical protein
VSVVPATFDVELGDEYTVVVEDTPVGVPLALHVSVETIVDVRALHDRLGALAVDAVVDEIRTARRAGVPAAGVTTTLITSPLDERIEYRQLLADRFAELGPAAFVEAPDMPDFDPDLEDEAEADWVLEYAPRNGPILHTIHAEVIADRPGCRLTPRHPATSGVELFTAVALLSELDAFILVGRLEREAEPEEFLYGARNAMNFDQLLSAVCVVEPRPPFGALVVDRRDVVDAYETPSGRLTPPRQSREWAPVGEALGKYLDFTVSPFRQLGGAGVDAASIDVAALAADVARAAVAKVERQAKSFKLPGKPEGYGRVVGYEPSVVRLIQAALADANVDVDEFLGDAT